VLVNTFQNTAAALASAAERRAVARHWIACARL
jgi:hypothetical protein